MKKNILSLLTVGLLAATTFVGCKKDTNDESIPAPVFAITNGDATITEGASATIAGTVSAANTVNLKTFKVTTPSGNGGVVSLYDTTFAKATTSFPFSKALVGLTLGTHVYTLIATDNNSQSSTATVTITVNTAGSGLTTYSANLLGDYKNASIGSFFSTSTGTVYNQADAKANVAKVDFAYYYGANNFATIASPSDADTKSIYNNATTGIQTWGSNVNTTVFSTSTSLDFSTATEAQITSATSSATATKSISLHVGDVRAFKTQAGKSGLFKVTALNVGTNNNGSITIDVKVQK